MQTLTYDRVHAESQPPRDCPNSRALFPAPLCFGYRRSRSVFGVRARLRS